MGGYETGLAHPPHYNKKEEVPVDEKDRKIKAQFAKSIDKGFDHDEMRFFVKPRDKDSK